jgi:hypothetical protein
MARDHAVDTLWIDLRRTGLAVARRLLAVSFIDKRSAVGSKII